MFICVNIKIPINLPNQIFISTCNKTGNFRYAYINAKNNFMKLNLYIYFNNYINKQLAYGLENLI